MARTIRRYGDNFDKDAAVRDFQAKLATDAINDTVDAPYEPTPVQLIEDDPIEVKEPEETIIRTEPEVKGLSLAEKKEWADRVKGLTDLERVFVLSRFSTNELYNELGKRIHKDDNYISSIRKLVNDYEDLNSTL